MVGRPAPDAAPGTSPSAPSSTACGCCSGRSISARRSSARSPSSPSPSSRTRSSRSGLELRRGRRSPSRLRERSHWRPPSLRAWSGARGSPPATRRCDASSPWPRPAQRCREHLELAPAAAQLEAHVSAPPHRRARLRHGGAARGALSGELRPVGGPPSRPAPSRCGPAAAGRSRPHRAGHTGQRRPRAVGPAHLLAARSGRLNVEPGDIRVARGRELNVRARATGTRPAAVLLRYENAGGGEGMAQMERAPDGVWRGVSTPS